MTHPQDGVPSKLGFIHSTWSLFLGHRPHHRTLDKAFKYCLKLGFISFGGPAGQISMMHQELVEKRRQISVHRYLHTLNYCVLLSDPEVTQRAIYISRLMHGIRGGIIAVVLFFLPSFLLLSLLAGLYFAYGNLPWVQGVFYGIKPAVVAVKGFSIMRHWYIVHRTDKRLSPVAQTFKSFVLESAR